jgi:cytoskeletal protein CcmA (bactofilin family)
MFKGRGKDAEIETLIGPGTEVVGDVRASGGLHVEGRVRGNVTAPGEGRALLSIAAGGVVEGNVEVPRVVVHGEVRGDIRARELVELGPTARVAGSVVYGVIEMAAGATIQGRLVSAPLGGAPAEPAAADPAATGDAL